MAVSKKKNKTESKVSRGLSPGFMNALSEKNGILVPILEAVKNDNNLIFEIRNNYIKIYHRGGVLLEIKQERNKNSYKVEKDSILGYMKKTKTISEDPKQKKLFSYLPKKYTISTKKDANDWADKFYILKSIMDIRLSKSNKLEKEFQQLVVRENNILGEANNTDYYIIDFEYTNEKYSTDFRFDLVALRWDSTPQEKRSPKNSRLAIIEMKYGDDAIYDKPNNSDDTKKKKKASLSKHIKDAEDFLSDDERKKAFLCEMKNLFNQKSDLGLILFNDKGKSKNIDCIKEEIEYIVLLAAHKPRNDNLKKEIKKIKEMKNADLKFVEASFMGYALYSSSMLNLKQFKEKNNFIQ